MRCGMHATCDADSVAHRRAWQSAGAAYAAPAPCAARLCHAKCAGGAMPADRSRSGGLQARRAWASRREPRAHPPQLTQPFDLLQPRTRTRTPSRASIANGMCPMPADLSARANPRPHIARMLASPACIAALARSTPRSRTHLPPGQGTPPSPLRPCKKRRRRTLSPAAARRYAMVSAILRPPSMCMCQ